MSGDNSRPPKSEMTRARARGPSGGFDAATHAAVTGGEVRAACERCGRGLGLLANRCAWEGCPGRQRREDYHMTLEEQATFKAALRRSARLIDLPPLRSRSTAEAEAWRDGWRAAMACAVLIAETARAPTAVDLLREQLEPPV